MTSIKRIQTAPNRTGYLVDDRLFWDYDDALRQTGDVRIYDKMALGLLAGMDVLDERKVPSALGGGKITRTSDACYELQDADGTVVYVAHASTEREGWHTRARESMREYLVNRAMQV